MIYEVFKYKNKKKHWFRAKKFFFFIISLKSQCKTFRHFIYTFIPHDGIYFNKMLYKLQINDVI